MKGNKTMTKKIRKMVEVKFANDKYNYCTNVNMNSTDESIRKYFVGNRFNVGQDMRVCTGVEISVYPDLE